MCNVELEFNVIKYKIQDRFLREIFPVYYDQKWPYTGVQHNCCIKCGRPMSHYEMRPTEALTPRAMCVSCYSQWQAFVEYTGRCLVCGRALEEWRLNNFYYNQKEVSNRLHDGLCKEYFSLLSVKALGHSTGLRDDSHGYSPPQYMIPQPIQAEQSYIPQEDYIDVGFEEIMRGKKKLLKAMGLAIPTIEMGNQKPVRGTYRGKPGNMLPKVIQRRR